MKCNVSTMDRLIRILAGLLIGVLGIYYESWWGLIGLLPMATGLTGFCGLYSILGIDTCKEDSTKGK